MSNLSETIKEVSCVLCNINNERSSQWYSREGDAIRKANQLNAWSKEKYIAVTGKVVDFRYCKGF